MDVKSLTFIFCCEVTAIIIKCACATVCVAQVFLWIETNNLSPSLVGKVYPINFVANAPTLVV